MAPQRKNTGNDDQHGSHRDPGNGKDKALHAATGAGVSKSRKNNGGSGLKDVTNASAVGSNENGSVVNGHVSEPGEAIKFPELPRQFLHSYRNTYHLQIPSSFSSLHNQAVLSNPNSIGLLSPTMNRPKEKRRVSKEALARAVRRDFMDQSVNELEVEASSVYIVRSGGKAFRMRFSPQGQGKK